MDSASIDETLYHLRIKTDDPDSEEAAMYQAFDVSFNYECQSDSITLSGVSEQNFYLG